MFSQPKPSLPYYSNPWNRTTQSVPLDGAAALVVLVPVLLVLGTREVYVNESIMCGLSLHNQMDIWRQLFASQMNCYLVASTFNNIAQEPQEATQ